MNITSDVVPVFRSFDETKAREFYCDFLGGEVQWEHRFEPSLPLYMEVKILDLVIHLTEHHGDASPGSTIRVLVDGIEELRQDLIAKKYSNARPGIEEQEWGMREMTIHDPFGNKIIFASPIAKKST